jgi:hypothetical protein
MSPHLDIDVEALRLDEESARALLDLSAVCSWVIVLAQRASAILAEAHCKEVSGLTETLRSQTTHSPLSFD